MNDLNNFCEHASLNFFGHFCLKCGCIFYEEKQIYTLKNKLFCEVVTTPPREEFEFIEKTIGYQLYFKYANKNMSEFYKKARYINVKFIRKLIEEFGFSTRAYILAILYLDLIYLNYDYQTILKEFKSELISVGCFLVAGKNYLILNSNSKVH